MSKIINLFSIIQNRSISLSAVCEGKRNFRKFMLINKRGSVIHKKKQCNSETRELPIDKRGVRDVGFEVNGTFVTIPEMIPEIIVPDLTDCKLRPYVSYRADDVYQEKFTSQQLFDAIYSEKIVKDFKAGKLKENGDPMAPSREETLTPEEAIVQAKKTGSDIF